MKVKNLFKSARNWTKGYYAKRGRSDVWLEPTDPKATCFCLTGAVMRCYSKPGQWMKVQDRIQKHLGMSLEEWNDDPRRTFAEVRALVEELNV